MGRFVITLRLLHFVDIFDDGNWMQYGSAFGRFANLTHQNKQSNRQFTSPLVADCKLHSAGLPLSIGRGYTLPTSALLNLSKKTVPSAPHWKIRGYRKNLVQ